MTIELLNQVSRQTFETVLLVGGPVLLVSLIVGVLISIFQAITQLQEVTLTFVPKIVAVFPHASPYATVDREGPCQLHQRSL